MIAIMWLIGLHVHGVISYKELGPCGQHVITRRSRASPELVLFSLVPRSHPQGGKRGLVNMDTIILGPGKGIWAFQSNCSFSTVIWLANRRNVTALLLNCRPAPAQPCWPIRSEICFSTGVSPRVLRASQIEETVRKSPDPFSSRDREVGSGHKTSLVTYPNPPGGLDITCNAYLLSQQYFLHSVAIQILKCHSYLTANAANQRSGSRLLRWFVVDLATEPHRTSYQITINLLNYGGKQSL